MATCSPLTDTFAAADARVAYRSTLTAENVMERARAIRPLLLRHADWADHERRVHPDVIAAFRQADLFDLSLAVRAGGPGLNFMTIIEVVAELAKDDAGSAWAFNLLQAGRGMASAIPQIHASLFKTGKELFCGAFIPDGTVTRVDGGYRISGKWPWSSGALHADCGGGLILLKDAAGEVIDKGLFWAPIGEGGLSVEDTWHTAGMRASGSNTIVADDLFVADMQVILDSAAPPREMIFSMPGMEPRDLWPLEARLPLGVIAPMLGAADGMIERVIAMFNKRGITYWKYANIAASEAAMMQLGRCQLQIETAWHHIRHVCAVIDGIAVERPLTMLEKSQVQGECGYAMRILRDVGQDLMDLAGSSAMATASPLQRLWRDLNTGSRHAFLYTLPSLELYGRALVGAPHNLKLYDGSVV